MLQGRGIVDTSLIKIQYQSLHTSKLKKIQTNHHIQQTPIPKKTLTLSTNFIVNSRLEMNIE
jgi:hypothetical protein